MGFFFPGRNVEEEEVGDEEDKSKLVTTGELPGPSPIFSKTSKLYQLGFESCGSIGVSDILHHSSAGTDEKKELEHVCTDTHAHKPFSLAKAKVQGSLQIFI